MTYSEEEALDNSLLPRHRTDDLVLSAFDGELLIQDTRRNRAHALNRQAAAVFHLADGSHSVEEIAVLASAELNEAVSPEAVWYALGLLQRLHLLEERVVTADDRITRKMLLKRAGVVVALASIASIAVPAASAHASGCIPAGNPCSVFNNHCCTGSCTGPGFGLSHCQ